MSDLSQNPYLTPEQAAAEAHATIYDLDSKPQVLNSPNSDDTPPSLTTQTPNVSVTETTPLAPPSHPTNSTLHIEPDKHSPRNLNFYHHLIAQYGHTKVFILLGIAIAVIIVSIILIILGATGIIGSQMLTVTIFSANTKQVCNQIQDEFNRKGVSPDSSRLNIVINTTHSSYISSINAKPDGWSLQMHVVIQQYTEKFKSNNLAFFLNPENPDCKPIAVSPIGIAMWKPVPEALGWPNANISWRDIINLAGNLTGWAAYGKPWGALRFGHSQPEFSNSRKLTLIAALYALMKATGAFSTADVNTTIAAAVLQKFSSLVQHIGSIDADLLNLMVK